MALAEQITQARRIVAVAQTHLRSLLLEAVIERDGSTDCQYCGVPTLVRPEAGQHFRERTLDHIVPLSCGGRDELSNATLVCRSCNARKSTRPQREYVVIR